MVKGINATCMDVGQNGEIIVLGAKDGKLVFFFFKHVFKDYN